MLHENFNSIDGAYEYIKLELQEKINASNQATLEAEKTVKKAEVLKTQEVELVRRCNDLTKEIAKLEQKAETVRSEARDYAKKTSDRLDKERNDFEAVRVKKRAELEGLEAELANQKNKLEQAHELLNQREKDLEAREGQLKQAIIEVEKQQNDFIRQQQAIDQAQSVHNDKVAKDKLEIDKMHVDIIEKHKVIELAEQDLDKKRANFEADRAEIQKYQKQAQTLLLSAEKNMANVEAMDKTLKEREARLNFRETTLRELDKTLTAKKIQLDDRAATQNSYK